ncbi:cupin domain-containing protein [Jeongeupia naejangsanensis]|uniref:Cupin domain-containing protein n=1 Tax=Jeongeupia naejangsanensis TaxID=613195 RepID=A0ABS2BMK9_9NEIS|nr:cupin domain-containing protein [Jeongeupia naejangsanensis]MBM3116867.1 cupin domain-containing protein [Jeongeupia naejangsanensis]
MRVIDTSNAEHYRWGDACDGWHLVKQTGLSVIEERVPPGGSEVRHAHARARQFFYVLAGELAIEVDGVTHRVTAGQGLDIAPTQAHQVCNRGDIDARFLVVSQPPSHNDRIPAPHTESC